MIHPQGLGLLSSPLKSRVAHCYPINPVLSAVGEWGRVSVTKKRSNFPFLSMFLTHFPPCYQMSLSLFFESTRQFPPQKPQCLPPGLCCSPQGLTSPSRTVSMPTSPPAPWSLDMCVPLGLCLWCPRSMECPLSAFLSASKNSYWRPCSSC